MRVLLSACCVWLVIATSASAQDAQAIARLKRALHLTPQQTDAWQTYQTVTAPDPGVQAREVSAQRLIPQLTTPRRIALIEAVMADRLADFRRRSVGINVFYGQLTPDQQRIFDQETSPRAPGAPSE